MNLPVPIQAYFDADRSNEGGALASAFMPGGIVKDEGRSHVGQEAIQAWWQMAKAKYQHVAEPFEMDEQDGVTRVRARVTGRFPGSPTTLTFAFHLADGRIAGLEIGA